MLASPSGMLGNERTSFQPPRQRSHRSLSQRSHCTAFLHLSTRCIMSRPTHAARVIVAMTRGAAILWNVGEGRTTHALVHVTWFRGWHCRCDTNLLPCCILYRASPLRLPPSAPRTAYLANLKLASNCLCACGMWHVCLQFR
jgi:hypothetical protein